MKCRVPQGSILAPMILLLYVIDVTVGLSSYISLFGVDAKLLGIYQTT